MNRNLLAKIHLFDYISSFYYQIMPMITIYVRITGRKKKNPRKINKENEGIRQTKPQNQTGDRKIEFSQRK